MSDLRLLRRLEAVADRQRHLARLRFSTSAWLAATVILLVWKCLPTPAIPLWIFALFVATVSAIAFRRFRRQDTDVPQAAAALEARYPELDSRLLTALAVKRDPPDQPYTYLQSSVLADTIEHARRHAWLEIIPSARLFGWQCGKFAAFIALVAAAIWASRPGVDAAALTAASATDDTAIASGEIDVEPGDVELERGRSLIVTARFPTPPTGGAQLVATDADGVVHRWPLSPSLDDPLFGARIPEVASDLTYHVESPGHQSRDFKVTTFEYPALVRADALIVHPAYSGRGEQRIEDVRRVSVHEGSTLTFECRFNKPLRSAVLRRAGETLTFGPLAPLTETDDDDDDVQAAVTWQPLESQTFELIVEDDAGRALKEPVQLHVTVLPNQPPELAVTFPSRDVEVSPLQELALEGTAWDDFGVQEYGIVIRTPAGEEQSIPLNAGAASASASEGTMAHLLALEDLQPDARDLLSYSFYADDIDGRGEPRRTFSDVFFAEVRHFDEEYREQPGQAPSGGQGGAGGGPQNPAQQLVELQRQIVIAEWNSIRRWTGPRASQQPTKYREEVQVITDSQAEAASQLGQVQSELEDPAARQHATQAGVFMTSAQEHLAAAQTEPSAEPLTPARNASQSAYQELLRLRDRLHNVQQQQAGGGGGGGGGGAMDRQLEQLELRNDRNRYEQERQAQTSAGGERAEQLQVLNRLRELAQRQADLNERIKELEDRRRAATSEDERQEIELELKRLREEQQELLRDADELNERMTQPQNQRQMADAREQLEQTRSELQNASNALESGEASRALTAGTRAQQQLEEMKEEFRRRSAGAFDETVRDLQQDARALADRQREIGDQLEHPPSDAADGRPSLRDTEQREQLGESLGEQREQLSALQERMREIIEQSEQSEPLLSQNLYDAILETREEQPEDALRMAEELLRRGFAAEGRQAEEQARRGIEQLEAGIDRAAESILGDELETLQRARQEVTDLTRALQNELAQAEPGAEERDGGRREPPAESLQDGAPFPGEPGERTDEQNPQTAGASRERGDQAEQPMQSGGDPPGSQPVQQSPSGDQNQPGDQPGEQSQPGEQPMQAGGAGQNGQAESGQRGQPSQSGQSGSPGAAGQPGGRGRSNSEASPAPAAAEAGALTDLFDDGGGPETAGGSGGDGFPLTGQDFSDWSDRLRDVEEMLSRPELRSQAGAIRERARDVRRDFKRHSKSPDWELVRTEIYGPLMELQSHLAEEIARRRPQNDLVPIDRDPVPDKYQGLVREYYEQLGRARRQSDGAATP